MESISSNGSEVIRAKNKDSVVALVLDTLEKDKQVLVFNNSKNSSEKTAENIALAIKSPKYKAELEDLSKKILKSSMLKH